LVIILYIIVCILFSFLTLLLKYLQILDDFILGIFYLAKFSFNWFFGDIQYYLSLLCCIIQQNTSLFCPSTKKNTSTYVLDFRWVCTFIYRCISKLFFFSNKITPQKCCHFIFLMNPYGIIGSVVEKHNSCTRNRKLSCMSIMSIFSFISENIFWWIRI